MTDSCSLGIDHPRNVWLLLGFRDSDRQAVAADEKQAESGNRMQVRSAIFIAAIVAASGRFFRTTRFKAIHCPAGQARVAAL